MTRRVGSGAPASRRSVRRPGYVARLSIRKLAGGFEGDPVAHGGELGDVVAQSFVGGDSVGVVVGAEVAETGGRVGQQVPDDDQDGTGDRDEGVEFAAAFDQAPVAFAGRRCWFWWPPRRSPSAPLRYGLPLPVLAAHAEAADATSPNSSR